MRNFTLVTVLLLLSLSKFCFCGSQTVDVQPGEEVTLQCSNIASYDAATFWFRLVNRTLVSCISVMFRSSSTPSYCDGLEKGKFEMTANISTIFLKIKPVNLSDSGLYFCGFYANFSVIFSELQEFERRLKLMSVILGALTAVLLTVIIGLIVKILKFQTGTVKSFWNLDSDSILGSHSAAMRNRKSASEREVEVHSIYANVTITD
uniref:Immunoglobulin domain-containing protein n=1 Tax=Acanthochromis polyacanthus TaxID=80966 RepID=A0A3Q1HVV5_9TELE